MEVSELYAHTLADQVYGLKPEDVHNLAAVFGHLWHFRDTPDVRGDTPAANWQFPSFFCELRDMDKRHPGSVDRLLGHCPMPWFYHDPRFEEIDGLVPPFQAILQIQEDTVNPGLFCRVDMIIENTMAARDHGWNPPPDYEFVNWAFVR